MTGRWHVNLKGMTLAQQEEAAAALTRERLTDMRRAFLSALVLDVDDLDLDAVDAFLDAREAEAVDQARRDFREALLECADVRAPTH